jgi:glycosyltransferase involved in cell wall biosynthesis
MSAGGRPRLLLVSMYPLDGEVYGPITRITHLRDALARMSELEVIAGLRLSRATQMVRYLASGRLRGLRGIYVETATTLPSPADLAFLAAARARRIPVLTYVRDAQPLFSEYRLAGSPKRWLSRQLFKPAFGSLMRVSTEVAFPSRGLAAVFGHDQNPILLPPGAPATVELPRRPDANRLLFVGGLRPPVHGGDILFEAIERSRAQGIEVELVSVSRRGEELPPPRPAWFHVEHGSGSRIHGLLPSVIASVTPYRCSPYNNLAVPIKVMEYLSYGRPLLVTDCTEQAAIVGSAGAGLVVPDSADGLASGIRALFEAGAAQLDRYSEAAHAAARQHSWDERARRILKLLKIEA